MRLFSFIGFHHYIKSILVQNLFCICKNKLETSTVYLFLLKYDFWLLFRSQLELVEFVFLASEVTYTVCPPAHSTAPPSSKHRM